VKSKSKFFCPQLIFFPKWFCIYFYSFNRKKAGLQGLIFKTFKNKDNLLQKILEPITTKLTPPSLDIATNSKGDVSLQSLIENYYSMKIKFINENDKVAKFL